MESTFTTYLEKYAWDQVISIFGEDKALELDRQHKERLTVERRLSAAKISVLQRQIPKVTKSSSGFYPLDSLKAGVEWPPEVAAVPAQRERFLSEEDFQLVFRMSKAEFRALDRYKRVRLKKELRLF